MVFLNDFLKLVRKKIESASLCKVSDHKLDHDPLQTMGIASSCRMFVWEASCFF